MVLTTVYFESLVFYLMGIAITALGLYQKSTFLKYFDDNWRTVFFRTPPCEQRGLQWHWYIMLLVWCFWR